MPLLPPLILLACAVGLGIYLGSRFLQRQRNRPVLIAFHLLPGIGALELIALLLRGAPNGVTPPGNAPGKAAALMLLVTLLIGFLTPVLLRDRSRGAITTALVAHAVCAVTALGLLAAWALRG